MSNNTSHQSPFTTRKQSTTPARVACQPPPPPPPNAPTQRKKLLQWGKGGGGPGLDSENGGWEKGGKMLVFVFTVYRTRSTPPALVGMLLKANNLRALIVSAFVLGKAVVFVILCLCLFFLHPKGLSAPSTARYRPRPRSYR